MGCVYSRTCIGDTCIPKDGGQVSNKAIKAGGGATGSVAEFSAASSDEGIESRDQFGRLNYNRDSEVGITRLSRVSSQFLPPDGSKTISIPNGNYELRYSFLSQRGYYPDALDKANQDSFCIHSPFGTSPNDHFFGVFDGHGEFGAQCSQFVKQKLCENLLRNSKFHVDAVEACHAAFLTTNSQLYADILDDSMSGTTAITVLVRGRKIYVANSGDSRAVIAERRDKELVAVDLSMDQTPFRADELERVKLCGARVLTLDQIEGLKNPDVQCWGTEEDDDGDPPRLWVPNGMYPGTAFTRSLGDSIAETIGVVATPEIIAMELTQEHPFFVLASDGVFEFLSSQNVVDMVAKYKDPHDACAAIVAESYRLWLQFETRTDDITIIVVHINGLTETNDGQSRNNAAVFRSTAPQVAEVTGAESPSPISWNQMNHRVRHDVSKARLRAIESSLENGHVWLPPSPSHRKTWEEEAHLEQALHDHFLFRKLTDSQSHVLLDCMQRIDVQPGEIVVEQGGEGDCFYVVGSGEFEVLASQEGKDREVPRVLQTYTAEKLSSFGELALMYNKPLQASVRALTNGTLWALRREDFRGILMSEFSNLSSLKLIRSVDILSRLTILQLSHIADLLSEVTFSDGQIIVNENVGLLALYIINKGQVKVTVDTDIMKIQKFSSLHDDQKEEQDLQSSKEIILQKTEGSYFGEWVLLGEEIDAFSAVAVGDVVCSVLTQEKFESVVGPLSRFPHRDRKSRDYSLEIHKETVPDVDPSSLSELQLSDLEWKTCLYSTDYCEIGLVSLKDSENFLSLKRFSRKRIKKLGKKEQVLKERNLMKSVKPRTGIPQVLRTCADQAYAGVLLNTCLACPFISILHTPLDEASAQFCAASVVASLEELHKNGILYRGISPDVLMLDQTGRLQLVDFRFGKQLSGERTFTICGMADSLAPEIVQGKGHGLSVDWWALGVLIYFMLQGEMPFGSWRQSEIDTYAKIAMGQLTLPETFSPEVVDLITKLLEVDETSRLGYHGPEAVKSHPWFHRIDWQRIADDSFPVPIEITSRINQHSEDCAIAPASPSSDVEELDDTSEWLEDW